MQISELAAWSLDHADFVALGVVRLPSPLYQPMLASLLSSVQLLWRCVGVAYVCESVGRHLDCIERCVCSEKVVLWSLSLPLPEVIS